MTLKDQKKLYELVGKQIKELRDSRKITQETFAKSLNLTRVSIVNIEKGRQRPSLHLLFDVCKILKVEFRDLMLPIESFVSDNNNSSSKSKWEKSIQNSSTVKGDPESQQKVSDFIKLAFSNIENDS